jgi:pimeloyl-ACP methyl ester carboxylesterase
MRLPAVPSRLVLLLPLLHGCAGLPARVESRAPPEAARGIVLVLDGAGGRQGASRAVARAVDRRRLPLHVRSFGWTHGVGHGLRDVRDADHARRQGGLLAAEVACLRAAFPGVPVSLVAYSAGSGVALAAAERLPPDSLERVVLLAPAVSACYDLTRALASARAGIDAFSSERDWLWLGIGTAIVGSADGRCGEISGRVGFQPPHPAVAGRLRQHPWDRSVAWTGNRGGHSGALTPAYLEAYVLPLLAP